MLNLLKDHRVQLVLALVAGVTVGVLFYPTKTIEERYESELKEIQRVNKEKVEKLEERLDKEVKVSKEVKEELSHKISSLTTENRRLSKSVKKRKFKLVKPDGTIIEKEYEESESEEVTSIVTEVREEFDRKVTSIENKWKKVHQKRVKTLQEQFQSELERVKKEKKEKLITINPKSFRPELGITTEKDVYFHSSYPLWGPLTVGGGASLDWETKEFGDARIGLGIEF